VTASHAPILDYASPRAKAPLRVGSRSTLRTSRGPHEFCIVESLDNQGEAIGAIVFSWLAMSPMIFVACWMLARGEVSAAMFGFILPAAGALTTWGIVQQSWGRTILRVTRDEITLRFVTPLRKLREHRWPADRLLSLLVIQESEGFEKNFAELELQFPSQTVKLFSGHPWRELTQLEREIRPMLDSPAPDAVPADAEDSQ
jgi:hypothetical protein